MNNKKGILFLNATELIIKGIRWGFEKNDWNTYVIHPHQYFEEEKIDKNTAHIRAIEKVVNQNKIDVIFVEFGVGWNWQQLYNYCNNKGIQFVIWGIEDVLSYPDWMNQTINCCHKYFTTVEEFIQPAKIRYNKDIKLLQFGVNPEFHKPQNPNKKDYPYDIVLLANNYGSREDKMQWFLKPLLNNKYDVAVYGNHWWVDKSRNFNLSEYPNVYKGYFDYNLLPIMYSTVPVALGVNCSDLSISQQSMRGFEYAGCAHNSCLVSFYTKSQERYFGDMIYLPKNSQETIDMTNEILNMTDEQRIEKSNILREFVYKNHNYIDRAKIVIDSL